MVDIGAPSSRFHANFGVRLVDTDLTIDNGQSAKSPTYYGTASWNGVDSNVVPGDDSRNYTDVLPSFNFVLDVTDVRRSASAPRVWSRRRTCTSWDSGNSYNFTRQVGSRVNIHTGVEDGFAFASGVAGNPQLDPYRASQFHAAYENYFAPGGLVSVGDLLQAGG